MGFPSPRQVQFSVALNYNRYNRYALLIYWIVFRVPCTIRMSCLYSRLFYNPLLKLTNNSLLPHLVFAHLFWPTSIFMSFHDFYQYWNIYEIFYMIRNELTSLSQLKISIIWNFGVLLGYVLRLFVFNLPTTFLNNFFCLFSSNKNNAYYLNLGNFRYIFNFLVTKFIVV